MSWLEIYVPLDRVDFGLKVLLAIWVLTVVVGFLLWIGFPRGRGPRP